MIESKGREGKGLAVPTALATTLDPLANVTEGKEIELVMREQMGITRDMVRST